MPVDLSVFDFRQKYFDRDYPEHGPWVAYESIGGGVMFRDARETRQEGLAIRKGHETEGSQGLVTLEVWDNRSQHSIRLDLGPEERQWLIDTLQKAGTTSSEPSPKA